MKQMTDKEFNDQAIKVLRQLGKMKKPFYNADVFIENKLVRVYDNTGKYCYDFDLKSGKITHNLTDDYFMDDRTKKYITRLLNKEKIIDNLVEILFILLLLGLAGYGITNRTQEKKQMPQKSIENNLKQLFQNDVKTISLDVFKNYNVR